MEKVEAICRRHILLLREANEDVYYAALKADDEWPISLRLFCHRYMLLNDLYQVDGPRYTPRGKPRTRAKARARTRAATSTAQAEDNKLANLVTALKSKLPFLGAGEIEVRLRDLISSTAEDWREKGLLIRKDSVLRKSPQLQRVWDDLSERASQSEISEAAIPTGTAKSKPHLRICIPNRAEEEFKYREFKLRGVLVIPNQSLCGPWRVSLSYALSSAERFFETSNWSLSRPVYALRIEILDGDGQCSSPITATPDNFREIRSHIWNRFLTLLLNNPRVLFSVVATPSEGTNGHQYTATVVP